MTRKTNRTLIAALLATSAALAAPAVADPAPSQGQTREVLITVKSDRAGHSPAAALVLAAIAAESDD